jgi:betaine-aldehyde dehydrogenase
MLTPEVQESFNLPSLSGETRNRPPAGPYYYRQLVGGVWQEAAGKERFVRESPAHDVPVGSYPLAGEADVDAAVAGARTAFDSGNWPRLKGAGRAAVLNRVAGLIRQHAPSLAYIEALESGKPIRQAESEMESAAGLWEYAASLCRSLCGDSYSTLGEAVLGLTLREPIGVVGMITPWNFPLLIISQKLPFALAAGCTAVIKPSELTPGTTLWLGKLLQEAGLPDGAVNIVTGYGTPVGSHLAAHPDVDMLSFTGSTAVGKKIVEASAGNLKKVSLELGGKNPQIIFPDADLPAALDAVVFGVYFNMGECCNSGSRVLVHESIAGEFTRQLLGKIKTVKVGDPLAGNTMVGAIINQTQFDKITASVESGKQQGASLRTGGKPLATPAGRFFEPTVFTGVAAGMHIAQEEIFGPVLSVLTFSSAEEAIELANQTMYGLSAGVWTRDIDTAFRLSRAIRAGTIWINTFMDGFPELPFGGYRQSGLGRELGRFSLEEFTELKTVQVHLGPRTDWWLGADAGQH